MTTSPAVLAPASSKPGGSRRDATAVRDRAEGSFTLELAIAAPALLVLLSLVIALGRMDVAASAVDQASAAAAREASLARTAGAAQLAAAAAARASLQQQGLQCSTVGARVDVTGFSVPVGQPSQVSATVTCVVTLASLMVPGLPGSRTLRSQTVSVLDRYRSR